MRLSEDQYAVQELMAQGTDEALADRVAPYRQLHPIQMTGTEGCG